MYEVLLRRRAEGQLDRARFSDHPRIVRATIALGTDPRPRGCRKLHEDIYRIRIGDYRAIYRVADERRVVVVGKVSPRREDTYRNFGELF